MVCLVIAIGCHSGHQDHHQNNGQQDIGVPQEGGQDHGAAAHGPDLACQPVGIVPVGLVVEGPGKLDAHGLVLLALGQVVADEEEDHAHHQHHQEVHIDGHTHGGAVGHHSHQQGDHRDDPDHHTEVLLVDIFLLGVPVHHEDAEDLHGHQEQGHEKDRIGLAAPAVGFPVGAKVDGQLVGQLVPQDQAGQDGQQGHHHGEEDESLVFFPEIHVADSIVAVIKQMETCDANLVTANNNLQLNQAALDEVRSDAQVETALVAQKKQLDDLKEKLSDMKSKSVAGKIEAPIAGTVSSISHVAGETLLAGEAAVVILPEGKGHSMKFNVSKKQAASLTVGDRGTVSNSWYFSDVVATLVAIKPSKEDPSNSKELTFNIEGDVMQGQSLTLSVGQKSALYDYTVPNNAVREDKDGKFILVLEQKQSPLGTRYYAVRRSVEVIASDDRRSAITGDVYEYEYVVTTSTKPIQEGQQVRLKDN